MREKARDLECERDDTKEIAAKTRRRCSLRAHGLIAPSFISRVPPLFFFFSLSSCHNSFSFLFAAALRFCNSLISQRIRSSSFGESRGKEVRRRCGRAVEDIRDLEQRQHMGETTTTTSTVLSMASSSGTAAATVGSTDMYAAIPTLPIAGALAAAGSETAELNGGTCGLLDRPDKKQVHSIVVVSLCCGK